MIKFLSGANWMRRLKVSGTLLPQLLVVISAFLIMIFLGSYFGSRIVNKHIGHHGDEIISVSAEVIKTYLQGYEITLNDTAFFLERLWAKNSNLSAARAAGMAEITGTAGAMREELVQWSQWLYSYDERFNNVIFLYGVVNGVFINSSGWEPPDGYTPESRVWYTGAYTAYGGVFYSDPYQDAHTGEYVMSLSRVLFDENDHPFGIIALDVFISSISNYIEDIQLMGSGYGMLMDSNRRIIAHPLSEIFGMHMKDIAGESETSAGREARHRDDTRFHSGYEQMEELLIAGEDVSAFNFISVMGGESVAFIRKIFNGWYIGLALPSKVYYKDVEVMRTTLFVTGIILALLLCTVLTFMHIAKNRSDSASKVKSSFLANMSHEIRTPMNAVIGMTELLLHEPLTMRQRDCVSDINASAHSLLSIINDILDLSKIEAGKLTLAPVNYDFPAMLDNINSMFKYVAQKKELEFRFESVGAIPKILYGDDIRLRQALTNLCGNAIKYTEKGYVRLKVNSLNDKLIFEIKDTGMGIKKEALPRLFDAFEQDKTDKNRNTIGTGLGLPITKAFVEMMGGSIMLDSEYEQGTVVTVIIPLVVGNESEAKYERETKTELTIHAPAARILLVDDNEFNLKVAHGLLMLHNIDAKKVSSGKEAIDMVRENDFDIVFMDHMMPEMDGIEATHEIRKLGGKYKTLPIIALTANAVQGAKEMFLLNGFNDFISKPIEIHKLTELLVEWLPRERIIQISNTGSFTVQAADTAEPVAAAQAVGAAQAVDTAQAVGTAQAAGTAQAVNSEESKKPAKAANSFLDDLDKTGEINTKIGLGLVSGIESIYLNNVRLFHQKIIAEHERLTGHIRDKDIHHFSISIHAMKSILSTIGAMKLSEAASQMEIASKNKDLNYCTERFEDFSEKLLSLHKALSVIFPQEETGASGK